VARPSDRDGKVTIPRHGTTHTIRNSDLLGATRLVTDATAGLTDLVEAMHERIARLPGLPPPKIDGRTGGITGLVYKTIRGVTRVVGGSIEALLACWRLRWARTIRPRNVSTHRRAQRCAGRLLGGHGQSAGHTMALRRDGRTLQLDAAALATSLRTSVATCW